MINLSRREYFLEGVKENIFWEELDNITAGQNMNPEISYTTPHLAKFENVFAGRKMENKFSIYLYRPLIQGLRTEILSKGTVSENNNGIKVVCRFEIPFRSVLILIVFSLLFIVPIYAFSYIAGFVVNILVFGFYMLVINSNYSDIKKEIKKQFDIIQEKTTAKSGP